MFNTTRIISALVMIGAIIIIALIDQFFINFIVFAVLLYLSLVKQKTFCFRKYFYYPFGYSFYFGKFIA